MAFSVTPGQQTNAAGSFYVKSEGYVQGTALNDPAVRNHLAAGLVPSTSSATISGGFGITDSLPTSGTTALAVMAVLALATSQSNLTGFTVFDQSAGMIQTPQTPVPVANAGLGINFYRFGSGARIAVACSSSTATTLAASASNVALYWDYTNQVLLASPGGTAIVAKLIDVDTSGNSQVLTNATTFTWLRTGFTAVIEI